MAITLDSKIPTGPLEDKWTNHKFDLKLVNPSNRRKFDVIVVGARCAGAPAAMLLARKGRRVLLVAGEEIVLAKALKTIGRIRIDSWSALKSPGAKRGSGPGFWTASLRTTRRAFRLRYT